MPAKKYRVDLTLAEREQLHALVSKGKVSARKAIRARILLKADQGLIDEQIVAALDVSMATAGRVRQRFVEVGLEAALVDKPRPGQARRLNGKQEAHLIALACSEAPQGSATWTLRLLAGMVVELGFVESISPETVRKVLKKTTSSRGNTNSGVSQR